MKNRMRVRVGYVCVRLNNRSIVPHILNTYIYIYSVVNCDVSKNLCTEQNVGFYPQLRLYSKASRIRSGVDQGDTLEINKRGGAWAVLELFSSQCVILQ